MPTDLLPRQDEDVDANPGDNISPDYVNGGIDQLENFANAGNPQAVQTQSAGGRPTQEGGPTGALGKPLGGGGALNKVQNAEKNGAKGPGAGMGDLANKAAKEAGEKALGTVAPEVQAALKGGKAARDFLRSFTGSPEARKRTLISGGVIGTAVLIITLVILVVLPQSGVSLLGDLETRVFAVADHEITMEGKNILSDYVAKEIVPNLGCSPTYNVIKYRKCMAERKAKEEETNKKTAEEDPLEGKGGLYDSLSNGNFATALNDRGISFSQDAGKIYINSADLEGGKLEITDAFSSGSTTNLFDYISEKDPVFGETVVSTVSDILQPTNSLRRNMTEWLWNRFGIKACAEACESQDATQDQGLENESEAAKNDALASLEQEKVVAPTGLVTAEEAQAAVTDIGENTDANLQPADHSSLSATSDTGTPTVLDDQVTKDLQQQSGALAGESLEKLATDFNAAEAEKENWIYEAMGKALSTITGNAISGDAVQGFMEAAAKFMGPVQWAFLIAQVALTAQKIPAIVETTLFAVRLQPAVSEFMLYASGTSEQKAGNKAVDPQILGSLLGGLTTAATVNLAGKSISPTPSNALQSPFLRKLVDPNNAENVTPAVTRNYLVDGKFALDGFAGNKSLSILTDFGNIMQASGATFVLRIINSVANVLSSFIKPILSAIMSAVGFDTLLNKIVTPFFKWFMTSVYTLPNLTHLSGEDRGTLLGVGGDYVGTQATAGLGAPANIGAASAQVSEALDEQQKQFEQQPLYARMFAKDTQYSLVSRLSLDMPFGFGTTVQSSFASIIENPLGKLFSSFAVLLHPDDAFAYSGIDVDPDDPLSDNAGVIQYAWPDNSPIFKQHAEDVLSKQKCSAQYQNDYAAWHATFQKDSANGQSYANTGNGCALILTTSCALGATYSYDPCNSSSGGTTQTTTTSTAKPTMDTSCTGMPSHGPLPNSQINLLIIHFTQSDVGGCGLATFFQNQGLGYGIQFNIDKTGKIYEYFPLDSQQETWHTPSVNSHAIGIEISAPDERGLMSNTTQFNSVAQLAGYLCTYYKIKCSDPKGDITGVFSTDAASGILGHDESPQGQHCDPDCQIDNGTTIINWTDADRCDASKHPYMEKLRQALGFDPTPGSNQPCPAGSNP